MRHSILLISCSLLLGSCAGGKQAVEAVISQPVDTTVQRQLDAARQLASQLSTGRVKFKGPVTIQIGGTNNTASATAIEKAKAPVAAAPHAVATDASTSAHGPPWYLYLGLVGGSALVGIFVGAYLRGKFSLLSFLK